jgi:hypothetical protein
VLLPPTTPFTAQVNAVLEVLLTTAMNCCVAPIRTVATLGATWTDIPLVTALTATATVLDVEVPD